MRRKEERMYSDKERKKIKAFTFEVETQMVKCMF